LLGKLVFSKSYDESVTSILEEATDLIRELNSLASRAEKGEGTIGKLLADHSLHDRLVETSAEIGRLSATLNEAIERSGREQSILGRLLADPDAGRDFALLIESLGESSRSLQEILDILRKGEGTLGMMLHDPSIATSMRNLFLGVQELGYVKRLVRNAELLGQEVALREARLSEEDFQETRNVQRLIDRGEGEPLSSSGPPPDAGDSTQDGGEPR
ncbi:MAG: hypothetical protein JXA90_04945, partial [Planctomycetes bacterium]|nr:hypothetical protein [Planctomycetota bacterium]